MFPSMFIFLHFLLPCYSLQFFNCVLHIHASMNSRTLKNTHNPFKLGILIHIVLHGHLLLTLQIHLLIVLILLFTMPTNLLNVSTHLMTMRIHLFFQLMPLIHQLQIYVSQFFFFLQFSLHNGLSSKVLKSILF